jgi:hypothetical protein
MSRGPRASDWATAILAAMFLGGQQANYDLHYPGGVVGQDSSDILDAPTKQAQFYRAATAYAFFSLVGARFVSSADDATAMLSRMNQVRSDLDTLAVTIGPAHCDTLSPSCSTTNIQSVAYWEAFELRLPSLEEHMLKLAVASLPATSIKDVIADLTSGAYLSAMETLATEGGELLLAAHYLAAGYRSSQEVVANQVTGKVEASVATAYKDLTAQAPGYMANVTWHQGAFDFAFAVAADACTQLSNHFPGSVTTADCTNRVGKPAPTIVQVLAVPPAL